MDYTILFELALIFLVAKLLGMLMRKLGLPQVVGMLVAGILLSPAIWNPMTGGSYVPIDKDNIAIKVIAELGVVLIMFMAGLETDINELKRNGLKAAFIALLGVVVPMGLGIAVSVPFFGAGSVKTVLKCVFIGVILTATSVSITVETLRELGKLRGKVGMTVMSAAIIDDVIGIVVLSLVLTLDGGATAAVAEPVWYTVLKIFLFFEAAIIVGIGCVALFKHIEKKFPNRRRTPIFGLVMCLLYAYAAEEFFGIADITGAYVAGIMLSVTRESNYIDRKIDVGTYMFFSPVFFVSIGLKIDFSGFTLDILWFALLFILAGLSGKFLGCAFAAKVCKYTTRESCQVGVGMLARGEVALIVAQKGIEGGIISPLYLAPVLMLVIVSSLTAPIVLKMLFKKEIAKGDDKLLGAKA